MQLMPLLISKCRSKHRQPMTEIDDILGWTKSSSGSYLQTTGLGNENEQKGNEDGIF